MQFAWNTVEFNKPAVGGTSFITIFLLSSLFFIAASRDCFAKEIISDLN